MEIHTWMFSVYKGNYNFAWKLGSDGWDSCLSAKYQNQKVTTPEY